MATLREIVAFATRAPSVHNSQPWSWRATAGGLDLYADRSRQLEVADPRGRNLTISCGAALEHATTLARALGWPAEVSLLPAPGDGDHLATVRFRRDRPDPAAEAEAALLRERRTDRRRFTAWPLPDDLLRRLTAASVGDHVSAVPITRPADRVRVELLVSRALWAERVDASFAAEQARWSEPSDSDGVPASARPVAGPRNGQRSRFAEAGRAVVVRESVEASDGLVVITGQGDEPRTWLDAGRLLCRVWTAAMTADLSLVPLSEVVEVEETRELLRKDVLGGRGEPLLLLRVGWQEVARSPLPSTPRRSVEEVLGPLARSRAARSGAARSGAARSSAAQSRAARPR